MKKFLLAYVLVASIACWTQTSSSSSSTQGSAAKTASAANNTKEHTMTGCIMVRNGEFFLRSKGHRGPIELLSAEDLTPHNGHEVTVTGTWANKETATEHEKNEEQKEGTAEKSNHTRQERGERHFQVAKLEMVADHCSTAAKSTSSAASTGATTPK